MSTSVNIGPLKAWYYDTPNPARGRVILVHGLGEHSLRHAGTAHELVRRGFDVIHFDRRGCGQSQGRQQWIESFDDYVDDLRSVLQWSKTARPPAKTFLYGHSLGGAIIVHTLAKTPDTEVAGVVLAAPAYLAGSGVSPIKIFMAKLLERYLPGLKVPSTLEIAAISRDPEVIAAYHRDPHNTNFNTVRQGTEIIRAVEQVPNLCRKLTIPTLIAHGDADRLVKVEGSRELIGQVAASDKTLKIFPGAYHELHNDLVRDEFYELFGDWLERRV